MQYKCKCTFIYQTTNSVLTPPQRLGFGIKIQFSDNFIQRTFKDPLMTLIFIFFLSSQDPLQMLIIPIHGTGCDSSRQDIVN